MTQKSDKMVYSFGGKKSEGDASMKMLLGGKGANLCEMVNIGIPVPPGFTVTTDVCDLYFRNNGKIPSGLAKQVDQALAKILKLTQKSLGDAKNPLLLSVRSGAPVSMPGMMDTILNLGINDEVVEGLAARSGNPRFAYDSYRRFIMMYGDVVMGVHRHGFEQLMTNTKKRLKLQFDHEVPAEELKKIVIQSKKRIAQSGQRFPEDPMEQLWGAIGAVFNSWHTSRAVTYRALNNIPESLGTAVNIQTMVFGNLGSTSGTGVAFTRDPATGENLFFGEWLRNAQGEDVVAGIRTPHRLDQKSAKKESLEATFPDAYKQLHTVQRKLETHFRDMQDLEFTIEEGTLWLLQTRTGKRTGFAAVKMAVDMKQEKLISAKEAIMRVDPEHLNHLLRPVFDMAAKKKAKVLAKGLPAGPGAATGKIALSADNAVAMASSGPVILTRHETSPEDIAGMDAAEGILTSTGGMTSHAALVARQMGKVCVAGCPEAVVDYKKKTLRVGGRTFKEGDYISLDGTTGEVLAGQIPTEPSEVVRVLVDGKRPSKKSTVYNTYATLMELADSFRALDIRTNADQPDQAKAAMAFGANGIGLCRTEHMFFGDKKIGPMRQMILADTLEERKAALKKLLPLQRADFAGIFKAMGGLPVTIRTLDPPLHEFLPQSKKDIAALAKAMNTTVAKVNTKIQALHEFNPMLGHRGCRLGISYPEVTQMQAQAIFEAAVKVSKSGIDVVPEIMIPLIGTATELKLQAKIVRETAEAVFKAKGARVKYLVGTMIEIPRAALTADEVAGVADFFSFGTNDLTQMTLGMSRDDSGAFLGEYENLDIYSASPFESIDQNGVGQLVQIAAEKGSHTKPNLKLGVCGEHGGDPASIEFFHKTGLNYVSCSPYRVPIARLAAAQAAIRFPRDKTTVAKRPPRKSLTALRITSSK